MDEPADALPDVTRGPVPLFAIKLLNGTRKVRRVSWTAQQTGLAGHIFAQRADIGRNNRHAESERKERHTTLEDVHIREDQRIGRNKVWLHLLIWNEPNDLMHQLTGAKLYDQSLGVAPIPLAPALDLAGDRA